MVQKKYNYTLFYSTFTVLHQVLKTLEMQNVPELSLTSILLLRAPLIPTGGHLSPRHTFNRKIRPSGRSILKSQVLASASLGSLSRIPKPKTKQATVPSHAPLRSLLPEPSLVWRKLCQPSFCKVFTQPP